MKDWNYAELSHLAKLNGGPEQLISCIEEGAFTKGVQSQTGVICGIGALCLLIGAGGTYLVTRLCRKHAAKTEKQSNDIVCGELAKEQLLKGISPEEKIKFKPENQSGDDAE